ncbi:ATP-grasp domain-containing protein, partial [Candidatus Symbiopectobacterium sp. NZEC135]|uniref:ATP-grasp domain-containing protein n=1 Tax=Candidatus Symbiopectobacterium sp. NZEC135 TaxID=2820471 RepID=UPI0022270A1E
MNILLCPAKIILQHQRSEWAFLQRNTPLVFATCSEHRIDVMNHLGDLFVVRFYDDFNDNPMVELDLYDYAKCHPVKEVHFLAEVDVNDRLGLTHQSAKEALYFRDKFLMKSLVQQYQVAIPEMALVKNATDIALFIETHGYPSVIKPTDGRGSQNVVVIRNDNQLKACLQMITPLHFHNLLIERFIEGHAYQINGLYLCGRPIFISASRANVSCLDFLSGESLGLVMECNSYLLQQLTGYTRYLLEEIFPTPNDTLFHLEVFVDKSQHIIFGELACR